MAQTISPGAYVIRNRDSSAVLHAHSYRDGEHISTSERDEERHRDRQIWWIEADAGFEDLNNCGEKAKTGPLYRITNIAKDLSLAEHMHKADGETPVIVFKTHGAPRQLWQFRRPKPYTDG
jgi:hypothetical protein